jgi:hypothetical protein
VLNNDFGRLFRHFKRTAFRLETLTEYRVAEEAEAFASFLAGRERPAGLYSEWIELVARSTNSGKVVERVLENDQPRSLFGDLPFVDFWLFDDTTAVEMEYDSQGGFRQAHEVGHDHLDRFIACQRLASAASITLREYLGRQSRAQGASGWTAGDEIRTRRPPPWQGGALPLSHSRS